MAGQVSLQKNDEDTFQSHSYEHMPRRVPFRNWSDIVLLSRLPGISTFTFDVTQAMM